MGERQSRGSLVIVVAPGVAHLVCCFSRPGAETPLRPRCHLWGERPGQERSPWGWGPCVPRISPWQALGTLRSGDPLHRAVNCWASFSVSLFHLPRNFPSFSRPCLNTFCYKSHIGSHKDPYTVCFLPIL